MKVKKMNSEKKPLVSIIIPTYNRANLIGETIESILAQTYTNWECIIVDDGSSDSTNLVVKKYVEIDNRILFYHRPNELPKGANSCRNYGFQLSKGEYIQWFDSDDLFTEDAIELKVNCFLLDKQLIVCACETSIFKNNKANILGVTVLKSTDLYTDYLKNSISFGIPVPMWKRDFLMNNDLFDEKLLRGQEFELHCRLLKRVKANYSIINKSLIYIRQHEDSITSKYMSGDIQKICSFFSVLRLVLKDIDQNNQLLIKEYLNNRYYKQILFTLRLKEFTIARKEAFFIFVHSFKLYSFLKLKVFLNYIIILLIILSNGSFYLKLKQWVRV